TFETRSFLVKASPKGTTQMVSYDGLIPGAPTEFDNCVYPYFFFFPFSARPFPPVDAQGNVIPPFEFGCGVQRASVTLIPAVGDDGTIVSVSTADFNPYYSYVVALRPDLTLKWAASLRDRLHDGCGVLVPYVGRRGCRPGTAVGLDPNTNQLPAIQAVDISSSTPVILPDGGVIYGGVDDYTGSRGHLMKFDRNGQFVGAYDFGWDSTPAIY